MPFGPPKLIVTMCTPEAQAKYHEPNVWAHKDKSSGTDSKQKAESRKDIDYHERLPGSDQWERGGELYEFVSCTPNNTPHRQRSMQQVSRSPHSVLALICVLLQVLVPVSKSAEVEKLGGIRNQHRDEKK